MNNKPKISLFKKIKKKVHYGLVFLTISEYLTKVGIEIKPYCLVREGVDSTRIPDISGLSSDYSTSFLEEEDAKTIKDYEYSKEEFLSRFDAGFKCLGLKYKDEIAAYMWINLNEFKFKQFEFRLLNKDEACLFGMETMEPYRGKNLAPFLRYRSYEVLKSMGKDKLYSITEVFNSPAVKYKKKLNAKKLILVLYISLFNRFNRTITLKTYQSLT